MAKWKRASRNAYYLEGDTHIAVIAKGQIDSWWWGVFKGDLYSSTGGELTHFAVSREYAKWHAGEKLKELENG